MENRLSQDKKLLAEFIFKIRKYFMYNPPPAPPGAGYQMESFILILQLIITCVWSGNSGLKNLVNKKLVGKIGSMILLKINSNATISVVTKE